ncbi:HPP family protein [Paenibacillus sp. P25]|nr:HPP family protein [Paenibacillus sp. P25]
MDLRTVAILLYLLLIYWLSLSFPTLKPLFYPTLGAFSYLFLSRTFELRGLLKLVAGAGAASLIGSLLFWSHTGVLAFMLTAASTILLIRRFHLNAPPILAVALIPYFSQPASWWNLSLSVMSSLIGLVAVLACAESLKEALERLALAVLGHGGIRRRSG